MTLDKAMQEYPIDPQRIKSSPHRAKVLEAELDWQEVQTSPIFKAGANAASSDKVRIGVYEDYLAKFKIKHTI
jgi:hypothetical protein